MDSQGLQKLLGFNITRLRNLHSLTIEGLAEKAGLSIGHVMDIIHTKKWVSADSLSRLADALCVPVFELFVPEGGSEAHEADRVHRLGLDLRKRIDKTVQDAFLEYFERPASKASGKKSTP